ncbi:uncharacterized protein METZ01_LOCUS26495 [marine metagenome]|uniref:Uncharacterized protein n=1 Tax=marine metagenome TaxID=408172 RepID=A0A381Q2S2_9ZZZZ
MVEIFSSIESYLNSILYPLNWVMFILIIGGGLYLTIQSKAKPLLKINKAFRLLLSKDQSQKGISSYSIKS